MRQLQLARAVPLNATAIIGLGKRRISALVEPSLMCAAHAIRTSPVGQTVEGLAGHTVFSLYQTERPARVAYWHRPPGS